MCRNWTEGLLAIMQVALLLVVLPLLPTGLSHSGGLPEEEREIPEQIVLPIHGLIPRSEEYHSFSLLLFCDEGHEVLRNKEALAREHPARERESGTPLGRYATVLYQSKVGVLRSKFEALSNRLGRAGLAIWLVQYYAKGTWVAATSLPINDKSVFPDLIDVDYERNRGYCNKLGLPSPDGTCVVTMRVHPDDFDKGRDEALLIQLGSRSLSGTAAILDSLVEGLRVSEPELSTELSYSEWKVLVQDICNRSTSTIPPAIKCSVQVIGPARR